MRIALLSDIHGNLAALQAVVADFERRAVDAVANLGDALSGPLLPLETARFLMARDWVHLAGNHERQILTSSPEACGLSDAYARAQLGRTELDWVASLKPAHAFSADVLFCHGTPAHDDEYFLDSVEPGRMRPATRGEIARRLGDVAAAVVACGHTHVPRIVRSGRGQLLLNPGSVGEPAFEDDETVYYCVESGAPDARYAILEGEGRQWRAQLIAVPYDHESMAALARERGRLDWEHYLRHGYVPEPGNSDPRKITTPATIPQDQPRR